MSFSCQSIYDSQAGIDIGLISFNGLSSARVGMQTVPIGLTTIVLLSTDLYTAQNSIDQ